MLTGPLSVPGLVAVFDYHRKKGYADLYSLHSWCGLLVFVLYAVQVSPLSCCDRILEHPRTGRHMAFPPLSGTARILQVASVHV